MNVTSGAGEDKEARQRASLFGGAADFFLGVWGSSSGNDVSKLGGSWVSEGVVGGEKAGDGVLEGV